MKKFFVMAALVGVALTSCMKNEVYVPTCDAPISFEVANYVAQTRVDDFATTETFGVNAWSYNGTAAHELMVNETVTYNGSQWTTAKPYYWPYTGTVDFIAYYPADEVPDIIYNYAGGDTYTYEDYTVGEDDLMYADKAIRYSENVNTYGFDGVPTLFRHALAKVNFEVKNAYPAEEDNDDITYEIVVDNITLKTYNTGDVTLENTGTGTASRGSWSVKDSAINVWTPDTTVSPATLTWEEEDDAITVLADDTPVAYATRDQYVLPQTLSDNVTVSVTYTVTQKHNGATIGVKQYTSDPIKLNTMGLTSWEMNKNITYTISIIAKRNQIFFDPAVQEWSTDDAAGGVTIQ
ncbi:MAG: fimbrillin family protein [Alistipes sp.]|nr:fimbrillin family protein [Alistipes sp.]